MLETTIAGSLPKPAWLAKPKMLWAPWALKGEDLAEAKRDATILALKEQEDIGIDIVSDGEMSRQHFVHGFLEHVGGIDFAMRVKMGIRNNRYEAEVPTVTGPLTRNRSVHGVEAAISRAHTKRRLKFTLPGPMTIIDTIADKHYGDRVKMAMRFAELLNEEALELEALGCDVIQFDEPAFNVYMDEVRSWGVAALERTAQGLKCTTTVHICYGYGIKANIDWKSGLGDEWTQYEKIFPASGQKQDRPGFARMHQFARAGAAPGPVEGQGRAAGRDRRRQRQARIARAGGERAQIDIALCAAREAFPLHQLRHGADGPQARAR